jgi:hypothetical protein
VQPNIALSLAGQSVFARMYPILTRRIPVEVEQKLYLLFPLLQAN